MQANVEFQFTHPGKGATVHGWSSQTHGEFQFTHPGKGATLASDVLPFMRDVSIHAPWEGCDPDEPHPRPSRLAVSIHAPWEGCDLREIILFTHTLCFNSRTLGRVRRRSYLLSYSVSICFNSRTLGRVRRCRLLTNCYIQSVSIHAPWEGCDLSRQYYSARA